MLAALAEGMGDPEALAELAKGNLRQKLPELAEALPGLMGSHQRLLLRSQLRHLDFIDREISQMDQEVATRMGPFDDMLIHEMGALLPFPVPLHPFIASFPGHSWQFVQHPHISFGVILFAILKHRMNFTCENSAD